MNYTDLPYDLLDTFAQGAVKYDDHSHHGSNDSLVRIVLPIYLADESEPLSAILDTGAPWCVLNPMEIQRIANKAVPLYAPDEPLLIRGIAYFGWLYRVPIRLEALIGQSLTVEATVFVPTLSPKKEWRYPNFIGLDGFLNRIRIALDPERNLFFFGELEG
jgi:hypothetical protein